MRLKKNNELFLGVYGDRKMKNRINGLNYIRVLCTLLILLFHSRIHYGFVTGIVILDEIISIGAVAIVAFFMLSGFSLRYNYSELRFDKENVKGYLKKRIAGIYPIYIFMLVIALIFKYRLPGGGYTLGMIPIQLSLLQVICNPLLNSYMFNDNWWYISSLFVLYLLFPILNEVLNWMSLNMKYVLSGILVVISWYVYCLNINFLNPNVFLFYYVNPIFRIPEFLIGMIVADFVKQLNIRIKGYITLVISLIVLLIIHLIFPQWLTNYNMYNLIAIPYFAFIIVAAAKMQTRTLSRIAESRFVKYVTELGMTIYLCQSFSIMTIERMNIEYNSKSIFMILTIVYAVIVHEVIEKPGKRLFYRILKV